MAEDVLQGSGLVGMDNWFDRVGQSDPRRRDIEGLPTWFALDLLPDFHFACRRCARESQPD